MAFEGSEGDAVATFPAVTPPCSDTSLQQQRISDAERFELPELPASIHPQLRAGRDS